MADYIQRSDISNQGPALPVSTARAAGLRVGSAVSDAIGAAPGIAARALGGYLPQPLVDAASALGDQGNRVALRDFLGGLVGSPTYNANAPAPAKAAATPAKALAAPAAAVAAATPATPLFTHPLTLHEATALSGVLGTLMPAPRPILPHEQVYAQTAGLSQSMFAQAVQAAQEKAQTDPQGAKADVTKAQTDYLNRQMEMLKSFNPQQLAMANVLNGGQ
jgi:hypothetical protein